jgi:hypothetical protein
VLLTEAGQKPYEYAERILQAHDPLFHLAVNLTNPVGLDQACSAMRLDSSWDRAGRARRPAPLGAHHPIPHFKESVLCVYYCGAHPGSWHWGSAWPLAARSQTTRQPRRCHPRPPALSMFSPSKA